MDLLAGSIISPSVPARRGGLGLFPCISTVFLDYKKKHEKIIHTPSSPTA
jgi:hypothetical protein